MLPQLEAEEGRRHERAQVTPLPVLDTPATLLGSLMRSCMTARTRNSYQVSCNTKHTHQVPTTASNPAQLLEDPSRGIEPPQKLSQSCSRWCDTRDTVWAVPAYLGQVLGKKLALGPRDAVIQDLPPLGDAELHDVAVDGEGVVSGRKPRQEDALLCPVGC